VIRILNFWLLGEGSNFRRLQRDLGDQDAVIGPGFDGKQLRPSKLRNFIA
jgi:hypothetical protein